ncbi:MAG TPA: hypothetical protein VEH84_17055 [Alphaproteobacteria bacterium]|nr:hypothetical protein [Alphaproteobacteria bacterium]
MNPGEKTAAVPEKPQFDDHKLLTLLQSAKAEVQGLRLIHLHLSLLRERDFSQQLAVRNIIAEIGAKASFLQSFSISNGDVIVLYKGLKLSSVTEVCQQIEQMFLAKTGLTGPNPYKEHSLYSIMELSLNFVNVIRFIEALGVGVGEAKAADTKPPITLEELAKLERSMAIFDLSPFLLNQPLISIAGEKQNEADYYELYISIKHLQERLSPNFDIAANKWLFNYFTTNLDSSVLKALNHGLNFIRGKRIGINVNLSTVISSAFIKFDERLPMDFRGNVVLEINKGDMLENLGLYQEVIEFAADRQYTVCIDGLNAFWVASLNLENMGADYAKIFWSPDMSEMHPDMKRDFQSRLQNTDTKFILSRCDTVTSLVFAQKMGIPLVQGRAVDNILRKGVTVLDAIKTASAMDDDW